MSQAIISSTAFDSSIRMFMETRSPLQQKQKQYVSIVWSFGERQELFYTGNISLMIELTYQNVCIDRSSQYFMPPSRANLHSTRLDDLVCGAKVFHLLLKLLQFGRRDVSLQLRLNEDIVDFIVFSATFSPVAKIVVALDSGKGDVAELNGRVLASEPSESSKLACCEGGDEGLKGVLDLMGSVLLMGVGDLEALWNSHSGGFEVLDMGKALANFSHHDLIILIKNFPMTFISYRLYYIQCQSENIKSCRSQPITRFYYCQANPLVES